TLSTLSTDYILFYDTSISKHFSLSLHDALPIYKSRLQAEYKIVVPKKFNLDLKTAGGHIKIGDLEGEAKAVTAGGALKFGNIQGDRKSTRLNSSHGSISYAVFCLKKKKNKINQQ